MAAYKAGVKVFSGPGGCLAALDLAREARKNLGDSAEVRKKSEKGEIVRMADTQSDIFFIQLYFKDVSCELEQFNP